MQSFNVGRAAAKWLGCGVLAVSMAACASNAPPEASQPASNGRQGTLATLPAGSDGSARKESETTVQISDDVRRECQLPEYAGDAPHFDYDNATLRARGANVLDDLAKCLTTGPLRNRTLTVIGRTDPRGSAEYNQELSANRAEAARNYLVQRGVQPGTIKIIARGEQGAQGTNEQTWARDRRVDIDLGDRAIENRGAASNLAASPGPVMEGTRMQTVSPGVVTPVNGPSHAATTEGTGVGMKSGKATSGVTPPTTPTATGKSTGTPSK